MDRHRCTAGVYHYTTTFRLAEAAESAMHTALGIADRTCGATPRVDARHRGPTTCAGTLGRRREVSAGVGD
jgi:hypothetical protein